MDWIPGIVNTICVWFDYLIYSISTACYVLFGAMTEMNVDSIGESFANLVGRLQTFLGLIMMFVIAFNLLKILVDPSRAGQSSGTIVKRIAISIVLLVSMNFIFNNIFGELQTALIESNTIEKIILGNDTSQTKGDAQYTGYKKYVSTGKYFAYQLFFAFVDVDNNPNAKQIKDDIMQARNDATLYDVVGVINDEGVYYRFPIISGIAGILLAVIFVSFAIDVGVRAFTLMLLEVIAPIPIIAYIADEKMFKAFMKAYISTFIELFARIFIIYITLFLMQFCMKSILGTVAGGETTSTLFPNMGSDVGTFFRALLLVAVIFSLFMFAKKLPSLAKSIFGLDFGNTSINPFKVTGKILKTGKHLGMAAGGLAIGAGLSAYAAARSGASAEDVAKATLRGAGRGAQSGYRANNIREAFNGQRDVYNNSRQYSQNLANQGGSSGIRAQRANAGNEQTIREANHNMEILNKTDEKIKNINKSAEASAFKNNYTGTDSSGRTINLSNYENRDHYVEAKTAASRANLEQLIKSGAASNVISTAESTLAHDTKQANADVDFATKATLDVNMAITGTTENTQVIDLNNHIKTNNSIYGDRSEVSNISDITVLKSDNSSLKNTEQTRINDASSNDTAINASQARARGAANAASHGSRNNGGGNRN